MKILFLILLFLALNARSATNSVECNYADIANAIATASEGDTILIGEGSCVVEDEIWIDRNISFTIAGSGTNSTTLISTNTSQVFFIFSNSSNVFTIRDINCVGSAENSGAFIVAGWNGKSSPGPYHFYNLQMTNILGRGISIGRGNAFGLIDHCSFKTQPSSGAKQCIDFEGAGYLSWTNANPLGTTNVQCVEDCYFYNGTNNGNGFFDAYDGAQIVWRHNFCDGNAPSGVHGYDSQPTSTRTWEIYNNIFTNITGSVTTLELRGGVGVVFSNTVYGANLALPAYYRSCNFQHSSTIDIYGYPGQNRTNIFANNATNDTAIGFGQTGYGFKTDYTDGTYTVYGGGYVKIGATLAETMTNLFNCINQNAEGRGTAYGETSEIGHDFLAVAVTTNSIITRNALDNPTNAFGYPAAFQPGVLTSYPLTGTNFVNTPVLWPCYAWSNTVNGASENFTLKDDTDDCSHNITNYFKEGRDYFNAEPDSETYTPLVYPHPLQTATAGDAPDETAPTVAVTSPGSTNKWHFTLTGTAADNVGVDHVTVSVNGGTAITATGTTTWTATVDLREGANTIIATAFDAIPNYTATNVTINFVPNQRVSLKGIRTAGGTLRSN